ncbi:helix-turn-helix domain-containing protein [Aurantimonas coralicida]|uniref:helix-turn-helix domain-containing protein n=1 Tax=Aurantimonas coralicida TaxID=182270 RepID=UPI00396A77FE|nr:helix-turn-helix domain-containing protein [Aurantimonas coralicida]
MSCYEHLSSAERERIAILLAAGHSKAGIAKTLGRRGRLSVANWNATRCQAATIRRS